MSSPRSVCPRAWSARLVHAAAGTSDIDAVDGYLMRALVGGPVIHDPDRCRYYALIPTAVGRPWEVTRDLEPLGLGSYVGVPSPGLNAATASSRTPYWSVPMESAGTLCVPAAVAALVEIARYELAGQASAADAPVSPSPRERRR